MDQDTSEINKAVNLYKDKSRSAMEMREYEHQRIKNFFKVWIRTKLKISGKHEYQIVSEAHIAIL